MRRINICFFVVVILFLQTNCASAINLNQFFELGNNVAIFPSNVDEIEEQNFLKSMSENLPEVVSDKSVFSTKTLKTKNFVILGNPINNLAYRKYFELPLRPFFAGSDISLDSSSLAFNKKSLPIKDYGFMFITVNPYNTQNYILFYGGFGKNGSQMLHSWDLQFKNYFVATKWHSYRWGAADITLDGIKLNNSDRQFNSDIFEDWKTFEDEFVSIRVKPDSKYLKNDSSNPFKTFFTGNSGQEIMANAVNFKKEAIIKALGKLNIKPGKKIQVYILDDKQDAYDYLGDIGARAEPQKDRAFYSDSTGGISVHEEMHVFLNNEKNYWPFWKSEGLCFFLDNDYFLNGKIDENAKEIIDEDPVMPHEDPGMIAGSFTGFLINNCGGSEKYLQFFQDCTSLENMEKSFRKIYKTSYKEVVQKWKASLK